MNVSLGKLTGWVKDQVKHGDYQTDSEVVREAVRRMKDSQPAEPESLQRLMDEAESSGFRKLTAKDWDRLRRLAASGLNR
jgi:putative addiction module CopG family antidote